MALAHLRPLFVEDLPRVEDLQGRAGRPELAQFGAQVARVRRFLLCRCSCCGGVGGGPGLPRLGGLRLVGEHFLAAHPGETDALVRQERPAARILDLPRSSL